MKWLQLIFAISLFGIPLIQAQGPLTKGPSDMPKNLTYGVALIYQYNKVICSGPHLKPWLILTVADCLYGKDAHTLYAEVSFGLDKPTVNVPARFYELHPGYRYENYTRNNVGLLVIRGERNWDVAEFKVPPVTDVQKYYGNTLPNTYVDEWYKDTIKFSEYYYLIPDSRNSLEMSNCHKSYGATAEGLYCVKSSRLEVYNKEQIGVPYYTWTDGAPKTLLGVYTGFKTDRKEEGHVFVSILQNIHWILQELDYYSCPPIYH